MTDESLSSKIFKTSNKYVAQERLLAKDVRSAVKKIFSELLNNASTKNRIISVDKAVYIIKRNIGEELSK